MKKKQIIVLMFSLQIDEETYPEYYRKTSEYVKRSNDVVPAPFEIGESVLHAYLKMQTHTCAHTTYTAYIQRLYDGYTVCSFLRLHI